MPIDERLLTISEYFNLFLNFFLEQKGASLYFVYYFIKDQINPEWYFNQCRYEGWNILMLEFRIEVWTDIVLKRSLAINLELVLEITAYFIHFPL